jgi:hypothetical protein
MALSIPFLFLHFRTLFHSTEGGVPLPSQIEDNMNHQTGNSIFTKAPSAPSNASALVTSEQAPGAPAETPQSKTRRSSQTLAKAKDSKPVATKILAQNDGRCRRYTFTGRRCRLAPFDPVSGLCFRHIGSQFQPSDEDLSSAFVGLLSGFDSPSRIHAFLTQVTVLLV